MDLQYKLGAGKDVFQEPPELSLACSLGLALVSKLFHEPAGFSLIRSTSCCKRTIPRVLRAQKRSGAKLLLLRHQATPLRAAPKLDRKRRTTLPSKQLPSPTPNDSESDCEAVVCPLLIILRVGSTQTLQAMPFMACAGTFTTPYGPYDYPEFLGWARGLEPFVSLRCFSSSSLPS